MCGKESKHLVSKCQDKDWEIRTYEKTDGVRWGGFMAWVD
jgi:hypothetical protein